MPDYNPWGTPIFPGASAFGVGSPAEAAERQPTIVDNILSHIAGALGRGFMAPGQALQSTTPITSEQMIAPAQDMSTMMSTGSGAFPASANELRMGIKAYHSTYQPFENYDFSRLGQVTRANTDSEWAHNLAQLGPWASERALTKEMGADHVLPVDIGGRGKLFSSLDDLEAAVRNHGGPENFRQKLINDGFGHVQVKDTEFGGNSYIGLSPDNFTVLKNPPPFPGTNSRSVAAPLAIKDAAEAEAAAPEMVRLYRGGGNNPGGPKWVTTDRKYAERYTTPGLAHSDGAGSFLHYVDVPATDPRVAMPAGQSVHSFEAAPDIADRLRPFYRAKQ